MYPPHSLLMPFLMWGGRAYVSVINMKNQYGSQNNDNLQSLGQATTVFLILNDSHGYIGSDTF